MRLNPSVYAPVDIRVTLRVVAALLVWKTLSGDYTNLIELARAPRAVDWGVFMQAGWVVKHLTRLADRVLVSEAVIQGIQLGACAALAVAVAVLNRWLVLIACLPLWAFHCYASIYLAPTFETEVCLCYLFLAVLWPGPWAGLVRGGREPTAAATTFGTTVLGMIGTWYFFAGLSKLRFDPNWVTTVHLEHMLPTFMVWSDAVPAWPRPANLMHDLFAAHPWLGQAAAAVTLAAELAFPLAVGSRWVRRVVVPGMAALHLVFFLAVGTLFLVSIVLLLSAVVPWRRLGAGGSAGPAAGDGRFQARGLAVLAAVVALHSACAVQNRNYFPVVNWAVFGWRYSDMSEPVEVFRVGYRDPADGQIKPIPHHRGGFLDYRFVSYTKALAAAYFQATSDADRRRVAGLARNLLAARRPEHSNRWLLGPLTHPSHAVVRSDPGDLSAATEFFFLKGRAHFADHSLVKEWDRVEPLEPPTSLSSAQ